MGAVANLFPAYTEADWRKAAEAALKGANLETLVSKTADGARIEPVYPPAEGPRATRPGGPWRVIARLDHPNAGEANAQALDDLANGADGLQIVFSGALGAYGFGLERFDSATLHEAFDGVHFDAGPHFELDLGPDAPDQALRFGALIERSGARPGDCRVAFGLDPFAASARGPFPADWRAHAEPFVETAQALRSKAFSGPFLVADARAVHAAGGSPAQELAFALAAAVSLLRLLEEIRDAASGSERAHRVPAGGRRERIGDNPEIPRVAHRFGRASSKPAASSLARLMCRRRAPGA